MLLGQIDRDGMVVREVVVPVGDIVYLKDILEAYPGLAAVHAPRRGALAESVRTEEPRRARVIIATTTGQASDLDEVLAELAAEIGLTVEGVQTPGGCC